MPKGIYIHKTGPIKSPLNRFLDYISPEPNTGCWLWLGTIEAAGYAVFSIWLAPHKYKTIKAHRYSYQCYKGKIPKELQIDHLCRNRGCVNPDHLEPVTSKINVLRGIAPTAVNAAKTHCIRGHELSGENLFIRKVGTRGCRICQRMHQNRWQREKRGTKNFKV